MAVYVSFVVLSALALWAVIYSRGHWAPKLALICIVPAFGVIVWHSLEGYRGWPAEIKPPDRAELVGQYIDEPTAIYLWLIPAGESRPRAYKIPYSRQLHEAAARAAGIAKRGGHPAFRVYRGRYVAYDLPPALPLKEPHQ